MQKLHAMGFSQVQSPLDNQRVAGRISHFATNWKVITEDQWVLRAVQGFLIPFREDPRQVHLPQPCRYAEGQMNLLRQEVQWRSQPNSDARAQIFYSQRNYMSRSWAHFHEGPKIMHIQYNLS